MYTAALLRCRGCVVLFIRGVTDTAELKYRRNSTRVPLLEFRIGSHSMMVLDVFFVEGVTVKNVSSLCNESRIYTRRVLYVSYCICSYCICTPWFFQEKPHGTSHGIPWDEVFIPRDIPWDPTGPHMGWFPWDISRGSTFYFGNIPWNPMGLLMGLLPI